MCSFCRSATGSSTHSNRHPTGQLRCIRSSHQRFLIQRPSSIASSAASAHGRRRVASPSMCERPRRLSQFGVPARTIEQRLGKALRVGKRRHSCTLRLPRSRRHPMLELSPIRSPGEARRNPQIDWPPKRTADRPRPLHRASNDMPQSTMNRVAPVRLYERCASARSAT